MTNENQMTEAEPIETPSTEMMRITAEGDPDVALAILEKKAATASRWAAAIQKILISQTYAEDWNEQGGNMCLSSAGAERVGRAFPINVYGVFSKKEEFADAKGSGYRYVFSGQGQMGDRTTYAEGIYSTRDEFLGKKGGEFRPLEDINENDIRAAAYHIFLGNIIKSLLGLRAIPKSHFDKMMQSVGKNPAAAKTVNRGAGTNGGTSQADFVMQKELAEICIEIDNSGLCVVEDNGHYETDFNPNGSEGIKGAEAICKALSSFTKDGKTVIGKGAKDLKGKWLENTLKKARELKAKSEEASNGN